MGVTQPRIPTMNIITADPVSQLVLDAFIPDADTLPDGSTYTTIFEVGATLRILAGTAAGSYANTGTVAVPAFTAVVEGVTGPTGATGATGPTGPTGPTGA